MCQAVGPDVQFMVGEPLFSKYDRDIVRAHRDDLFKELSDSLVPWVFGASGVPGLKRFGESIGPGFSVRRARDFVRFGSHTERLAE
jgi:hypothetical protein